MRIKKFESFKLKYAEFNRLKSVSLWILGAKHKKIVVLISSLRSLLSLLDLVFMYLITLYITILSKAEVDSNALSNTYLGALNSNQVFYAIVFILIVKNIGSIVLQRYALGSLAMREAEVGTFLAQTTILEGDDVTKMSNSSELLQTLSSTIRIIFSNLFQSIISFLGNVTTLLAISIALFVFNWRLAIVLFAFYGISGFLLSVYIGRRQQIIGKKIQTIDKTLLQMYAELATLKIELKLSHKNSDFVRNIHSHRQSLTRIQGQGQLQMFLPRYLLEISLIIGVAIGIFYVSTFDKNSPLLAVVALLVAAGFRILPSLNAVILGLGSFRNCVSALNTMEELGQRFGIRNSGMIYDLANENLELTPFDGDLVFDHVTYRFPNALQSIYSDFNLVLRRNNTLLVKGESGSGKTTLIALATGILTPQSGKIVMRSHDDEIPMNHSISGISYLRQDVPLFDESFGYNIAMRSVNDSDQLQLIKASKSAGILDRILSSPESFNTKIGEKGSLLSAGEKQRLGLARSLFSEPSLLILDEPTANLDSDSELLVWDSLTELKGKVSILIVSHKEVPLEVFDDFLIRRVEAEDSELPLESG